MTVEYAPKGLIGVLTPQANTTVEPEFAVLLPPGTASLNARMMSGKKSIADRLYDYINSVETHLQQFANAPVDAFAFGTTGASYLIGAAKEDSLIDSVRNSTDKRLVTSASAVCDALRLLNAKRIGLVSPYPAALTQASVGYWQERGFGVAAQASAYEKSDQFHPIYSMVGERASIALADIRDAEVDAIVMLGTGMPTLAALLKAAGEDGPPVLSCMLALVWRSVVAVGDDEPHRAELMRWIKGTEWKRRYKAHYPE